MFVELLLIGCSLWLALSCLGVLRDFRLLRDGLLAIQEGRIGLLGPRFFCDSASRLWRTLLIVCQAQRGHREVEQRYQDVLSSSGEIVRQLDQEEQASRTTCDLLLRQTSPEVSATAVILLGPAGEIQHLTTRGIAKERIQGPLHSYLECLKDEEGLESSRKIRYRHFSGRSYPTLNFQSLGFTSCSLAPLRRDGVIFGALWLGFSEQGASLSSKKLQFIQSLTEHCADSFIAAQCFQTKLEESSREREWLLGMSHDLKAPGNSALYSLRDLLSEEVGSLSEEQRIRLEIIESCLNDQLDLVGDILDLAKHRQGLLSPKKETVALITLLQPLLSVYALQAQRKGIRFESQDIPPYFCEADPGHVKRIVGNLLSNACKYTDSGSIRLMVMRNGAQVQIEVEDSGIGIPASARHRLFREFTRFENASSRVGVGLGLRIAKTLAELNGGDLRYEEARLGGSLFSLTLPLAPMPSAETSASGRSPAAPRAAYKNILIVDDDLCAQRTHSRYLQDLAESIFTATTCDEAIALLHSAEPELVLSDLQLENETSERLLDAAHALPKRVRVLLTTGSGKRDFLHKLEKKYRLQVLEKPFSRELLHQVLRR